MSIRGELADLMVKVDPMLYRKFITKDRKGNSVLYVQLYKSLYGLMRSALLFYRKLRKELEDYDFIVNSYDACVANLTVPFRDNGSNPQDSTSGNDKMPGVGRGSKTNP